MKLRKPCPHGWYDGHEVVRGDVHLDPCPGGVFLPDDTLIVERDVLGRISRGVALALVQSNLDVKGKWSRAKNDVFAQTVLDALSVREAE